MQEDAVKDLVGSFRVPFHRKRTGVREMVEHPFLLPHETIARMAQDHRAQLLCTDPDVLALPKVTSSGVVQEDGAGQTVLMRLYVDGVPFLKNIPGLGALFRYDTRKREKTNLMVFLRPHIVRNAQDTRRVSLDRYDHMRRAQDNSQPESRWTMPDMPTSSLPTLPRLPVLPGDPLPPQDGAIGNGMDSAGPAHSPSGGVPTVDLRTSNQHASLRQTPPPTEITERMYPAPRVSEQPDYQPQPPNFASTAAALVTSA